MKPSRILLVDDEESILYVIKFQLELDGFEVITADSVKQAKALLATEKFDIILSDIRLPGESGLTLLEQKHTPVIYMTGFSDVEKHQILGLGAIALLQKPFEFKTLVAFIRRALNSAST